MNYIKKLVPILAIAVGAGFISSYTGPFVFHLDVFFYPIIVGLALIAVQKESMSYKYLPILVLGSLVFGLVVAVNMMMQWYFESVQFYISHTGHMIPFGYNFSILDQVYLALSIAFISFMAGLVGIVIKGFYVLHHRAPQPISNSRE